MIAQYRKTIAGLIGAILTWGVTASPDGFSAPELWGLAAAVATVLGVYGVANDPKAGGDGGYVDGMLLLVAVMFFLLGVLSVKGGLL